MKRQASSIVAIAALSLHWACGGDPETTTSGADPSGQGGASGGGAAGGGAAGGGAGGSSGEVVGSVCGALQGGLDILACAATYLTGAGSDSAGGVAVTSDGAVLYAGSIAEGDLGVPAASLLSGGSAGVVRLSADGRTVLGGLLAVSKDFSKRLAWTTFNGEKGSGADSVGVAAGGATAAIVMKQKIDPAKHTSTTDIPLLTFDAIQSTPGGGESDGYLVVLPSP